MSRWLTIFLLGLPLPAPAHALKIVTLNPSLTEIVYALHQENSIVGTVAESDQPAAAKNLHHVGSYAKPSIEKIVELKPDVIFTFKEGVDQITPQLKRAGLPLQTYEAKKIEDFEPLLKELGHELGAENQATEVIQKWNAGWRLLDKASPSKSVVLQLDQTPLIVAGGDTFLSEILSRCGFKNSFASQSGYPSLSWEAVFNKDIDIVAVLIENLTKTEENELRTKWSGLPSFKNKKIVFFDPHHLSRLTPSLPAAAKNFCAALGDVR